MPLTKLCNINDFEDDEDILQVALDGYEPFAVYCLEDQYFVTEDTCSHGQASLSEGGDLEEFEIKCSWHDGRFDIRSGIPTAAPCTKPIRAFAVTRDGDDLFIDPESAVDPDLI